MTTDAVELLTDAAPETLPIASHGTGGTPSDQSVVREVLLAPARRWPRVDLAELWAYRGLFLFLVWRDVKVRYAQTVLGAGWAVIQPVVTMVVFTVIFGRFASIPSDGVPYPVFSLAALVPWTYFAQALSGASNSLVASSNLITKIYFPRLVIPYAAVIGGLVSFGIAFVLLLVVAIGYGIMPSPAAVLAVPGLLLIAMLTAAGTGCWLAAFNIQYRDIRNITGFLVQIWMYASPVVYPLSLAPERYRPLYLLNPMTGVIEGFRAVLLGTGPLDPVATLVAATVAAALFVTGTLYFRRTERIFADVA